MATISKVKGSKSPTKAYSPLRLSPRFGPSVKSKVRGSREPSAAAALVFFGIVDDCAINRAGVKFAKLTPHESYGLPDPIRPNAQDREPMTLRASLRVLKPSVLRFDSISSVF